MRLWITVGLVLLTLTAAAGQNLTLLVNQDFEDGELGWTTWPDESQSKAELDATVAQHGKQSLRITALRSGDRMYACAPLVAFEPKTVYRLGVCIRKPENMPDSSVVVLVNWRDPQTGAINSRSYPAQVHTRQVGEWVERTGLIVAPNDGTKAQVLLAVEYTVGTVWFDNVTIEKIGDPSELKSDVWTNQTIGVEIGSGPLSRYGKHQEANDAIYQMATRYNDLVFQDAYVERALRDVERCAFYRVKPRPEALRQRFTEADEQLNVTYNAYIAAFKGKAEAEKAAFATEADKLAGQLTALKMDLQKELDALRPANVAMPKHLGRQPRSVRPIDPNGHMNRLLFGCWSPTQFTAWEKPFELEFHSIAPGEPKAYTPTELDFSNITTACDDLQKLGYSGTFSYLGFGIHEYVYAPKWLVEKYQDEPDFLKLSADGIKGAVGGSNHSLNWLHPAVRAHIREYLTQYARFCKTEPRVLFHEVDQEAYPYFSTPKGQRETCYGPQGEAAFRVRLQGKYQDIATLNREWGSGYSDFAAIVPPPDAFIGRKEITPLVAEWEAFRDDAYLAYLKLIYDSLKAGDPDKPVVARHSSLLGEINGARIFETCDVLSFHSGAPQMQLCNVYLASLNRYAHKGLGYMEDFWGCQEERSRAWDERAQRRGLEKHICDETAWGRTLQMKWYAYTAGSYVFTYNGNWFNPQYDLTTIRHCAPALAVAKQKMEQLDWVLTHSQIAPAKALVLQPSASMRNERPDIRTYTQILDIHQNLHKWDIRYELLPEEYFQEGRAKLSDFNVVILPAAKYLAAGLQQQLVDYARSKGKLLILIGENGTYDELARSCGLLAKALGADYTTTDLHRGGKDIKIGQGRAWIIPSLAGLQDYMDFPKMVMACSTGEVEGGLLRITDDGERFVFVLNRDVDNPREVVVTSWQPVREAVDVLVPGGCPVPVRQTGGQYSMDVRLGPGEMTAVWLR